MPLELARFKLAPKWLIVGDGSKTHLLCKPMAGHRNGKAYHLYTRSGSSLVKKYGNPDQSTICTFFFHTFPFFHHISTIMVLLFPHGSFPYLCILCCCGYLWNPIQSSDPDASVVSKIHLMICLLWHWVYHILYIHITHIYKCIHTYIYIYINTYIYITYIYIDVMSSSQIDSHFAVHHISQPMSLLASTQHRAPQHRVPGQGLGRGFFSRGNGLIVVNNG